jgi:hypothetical protein
MSDDDLDAEQEIDLPDLFQEPMIEERVASVMFEIEIDDTLATAVRRRTLTSDAAVIIASLVYRPNDPSPLAPAPPCFLMDGSLADPQHQREKVFS